MLPGNYRGMPKEPVPVRAEALPLPKGPYSYAVRAGGFLFVSGLGPVDPASGAVIEGAMPEHARRTLENLAVLLAAAGATTKNVVKTTIYLLDMSDFQEMNQVYSSFFPENPPARTTIQAAALPAGFTIEIEAIAWLGE